MSKQTENRRPCIYLGAALARYGFGNNHPFGNDRMYAFQKEFLRQGLALKTRIREPVHAHMKDLALFHTEDYLTKLERFSRTGTGFLDQGDTPAFPGILEAALTVAGSVLDAIEQLMQGSCRRAFVPIAGLHHARRHSAAGFCAINDCGIAIEALKQRHGLSRIAYIDIDAHHGDGVFYAFESDPAVIFADMHEDGRYLYPGTGAVTETGKGPAAGLKLNIPLPQEANDTAFFKLWPRLEQFIADSEPEFILFQCGADSIAGDPITHLRLSPKAHAFGCRQLCSLADKFCQGRLLALGGGGYNRPNLATAWTQVVAAMVAS